MGVQDPDADIVARIVERYLHGNLTKIQLKFP